MEEIDKIRLKLAKANDANENTNNSGKDYMTIRDSLTDISLLLCRVERAVGECPNENSGLNIPVVIGRFCIGQQVEWDELKYWVVEDNGEDKVLVANSKTQQHSEYNDWWVNRDELNAL